MSRDDVGHDVRRAAQPGEDSVEITLCASPENLLQAVIGLSCREQALGGMPAHRLGRNCAVPL